MLFNELSTAYREFYDANINGADYSVKVVNRELFPGTISVNNLNKSTFSALGGDEVVANITILRYEAGEIAGFPDTGKANYIYRFIFTITVNGVRNAVPQYPIWLEISYPADSVSTVLFAACDYTDGGSPAQEGFVPLDYYYGRGWMRFAAGQLNAREFYLAAEVRSGAAGGKLFPLWICLGIIGLAGVAAGIYLILLKKKKLPEKLIIKKLYNKIHKEDYSSAAEITDNLLEPAVEAKKAPPKNKSKKKARRNK